MEDLPPPKGDAELPRRRWGLHTADWTVAYDLLETLYGRFETTVDRKASTRLDQTTVAVGDVAVDRLCLAGVSKIELPPRAEFTVAEVVSGVGDWDTTQERRRTQPGDVVNYQNGLPMTWGRDVLDLRLIRMPFSAITALAADHTGADPAVFRFTSMAPVSPNAAAAWKRLAAYVGGELTRPESTITQPLALAELKRLVAAGALRTFAHTAVPQDSRRRERAVPASVRRACALVDSAPQRDLTTADMADAARISPRGLQKAFRRHIGMTPAQYLRRARLDCAHRDLQTGNPVTTTVAEIAGRWGFVHLGRFAASYREMFGCLPSETLRT
jgi:AraC-like DNA-binding protein